MNVLETFYYLFESDAKKLEEGVAKADKQTDKLKRNLDETDKRASMLGSSLLEAVKGIGLTLAAGFSATAIVALARQTADSIVQTDQLAQSLGVAAGELDVWDAAAASAGGTLGGLSGSLRAFNERVHDLTRTGSPEMLAIFQRMGLSLDEVKAKSAQPLELLREMADGVKELSDAEGAALGQKLGLDPGTVALLRQGRIGLDEVIARQRELGGLTTEQIETARKYRESQMRLARIWDDLRRRVVVTILPALERLNGFLEAGGRFAREHAGAIKWGLGIIAAALTGALAPALLAAARAGWAFIAPFLPMAAAIAALGTVVGLVAEDLYMFMSGQDSAIGELAKKWPWVGDAIRAVGDALAWLIALGAGVARAFGAIFTGGPAAAIESFRATIRQIGADMEAQYPALAGVGDLLAGVAESAMIPFRVLVAVVEGATATIAALIHDGPVGAVREMVDWIGRLGGNFPGLAAAATAASDAISRGLRGVLDLFGRIFAAIGRVVGALPGLGPLAGLAGRLLGGGQVPAGLAQGQQQLAAAGASPVGAVSSTAISNSRTSSRSTTVQVDRVEVNTQATDADGIASGVGSALEREMRSAANSYDDGVLA